MATLPYPHQSQYTMKMRAPIYPHHKHTAVYQQHNAQPTHNNSQLYPITNGYPQQQSQPVIVNPLPFPLPPPHCIQPQPLPLPIHQQRQPPRDMVQLQPPIRAPPLKKRKLNTNTVADQNKLTQLQQTLNQTLAENKDLVHKMGALQQQLNHSISKKQYLEKRNEYLENSVKEFENKNKNLLNRQNQMETHKKSLDEHIRTMQKNKTKHIKIIKDQLQIINGKDFDIAKLTNALTVKNNELLNLNNKYKKIKEVTAKLYLECVNGEEPRWDLINIQTAADGIIRDKELAILRQKITCNYPQGLYHVCGIGKWKTDQIIIEPVKAFVELNGEYNTKPNMILKENTLNMCQVIEKYLIKYDHRIPALNGQYGIRALIDIPKDTICGQYFGGEISTTSFSKIFEGTAVEHDHNVYALDQEIDEMELKRIKKANKSRNKHNNNNNKNKHNYNNNDDDDDNKTFVVDPFIIDNWTGCNELLMPYINDCRANIDNMGPTKNDNKYYNVEFVGMKINGWTQTYLITKRDIKKGEQLMTYYGEIFGLAVKKQMQNEEAKQTKKIRIDSEVLKELKNEFSGTYRLCKFS